MVSVDDGLAAVFGALIGAGISLIVARWASAQKEDELFYRALDFLGGGSQKRTLGISAIDLYWYSGRHRSVCISLLVGSALYLLAESDQRQSALERYNLERIVEVLTRITKATDSQKPSYESLLDGIREAMQDGRRAGVMVEQDLLKRWEARVSAIVTA